MSHFGNAKILPWGDQQMNPELFNQLGGMNIAGEQFIPPTVAEMQQLYTTELGIADMRSTVKNVNASASTSQDNQQVVQGMQAMRPQQAEAQQQQGPQKNQRAFVGIVTSMEDNYGFVDNDVFFATTVVRGRMPLVQEVVMVEAKFNPSMPFQWHAFSIELLETPHEQKLVNDMNSHVYPKHNRDSHLEETTNVYVKSEIGSVVDISSIPTYIKHMTPNVLKEVYSSLGYDKVSVLASYDSVEDNYGHIYGKATGICRFQAVNGIATGCKAEIVYGKKDCLINQWTKITSNKNFPHTHPSPKFDAMAFNDWQLEKKRNIGYGNGTRNTLQNKQNECCSSVEDESSFRQIEDENTSQSVDKFGKEPRNEITDAGIESSYSKQLNGEQNGVFNVRNKRECAVPDCSSKGSKALQGVVFHGFPKNEDRTVLWCRYMNIRLSCSQGKGRTLCSLHFERKWYDKRGYLKNRNVAIPTKLAYGGDVRKMVKIENVTKKTKMAKILVSVIEKVNSLPEDIAVKMIREIEEPLVVRSVTYKNERYYRKENMYDNIKEKRKVHFSTPIVPQRKRAKTCVNLKRNGNGQQTGKHPPQSNIFDLLNMDESHRKNGKCTD